MRNLEHIKYASFFNFLKIDILIFLFVLAREALWLIAFKKLNQSLAALACYE